MDDPEPGSDDTAEKRVKKKEQEALVTRRDGNWDVCGTCSRLMGGGSSMKEHPGMRSWM